MKRANWSFLSTYRTSQDDTSTGRITEGDLPSNHLAADMWPRLYLRAPLWPVILMRVLPRDALISAFHCESQWWRKAYEAAQSVSVFEPVDTWFGEEFNVFICISLTWFNSPVNISHLRKVYEKVSDSCSRLDSCLYKTFKTTNCILTICFYIFSCCCLKG